MTRLRRLLAWAARRMPGARWAVILPAYAWMLLFFLVPFVIVGKIAVSQAALAQPPYTPLFEWASGAVLQIQVSFANFLWLAQDRLYVVAYLNSLKIAAIATALTLLVGYPLAYAIARSPQPWRVLFLLLVILPFWTSFLIRVYAWIGILKSNGLLNNLLIGIGLIDQPLEILYTDTAVYLGIVYSYLPFMVLPLYATLEKLDDSLLEAASDLGARPATAFFTVTLPLSLPGIVAGCLLVFIPAIGEYVIPTLLGGPDTLMIGSVLWNEFFANRDWPVASAVAIVLLLVLVLPIMAFQAAEGRRVQRRAGGEGAE